VEQKPSSRNKRSGNTSAHVCPNWNTLADDSARVTDNREITKVLGNTRTDL